MRQVLSLDWDWFTGDRTVHDGCCGWSCSFTNNRNRGANKMTFEDGEDEPMILDPVSRTRGILESVREVGQLVVAECHGSIVPLIQKGDEIDHFDAHADDGPYGPDSGYIMDHRVTCGNWVQAVVHRHQARVNHVPVRAYRRPDKMWCIWQFHPSGEKFYDPNSSLAELREQGIDLPRKIEKGVLTVLPKYDLVFVCKSSPWTPPIHDANLYALVAGLAAKCPTGIRFYGHRARELRREYTRFQGTVGLPAAPTE